MTFHSTEFQPHHGITPVTIELGPLEHFMETHTASKEAIERELSTDDVGKIQAEALAGYPEKWAFGDAMTTRQYIAEKLLFLLTQHLGSQPSYFYVADKWWNKRIARTRKDGTIFFLERWSKSQGKWMQTRGQILQILDASTIWIGDTLIEP